MKNYIYLLVLIALFTSCSKELVFENQSFVKKSNLPCATNCPKITVTIPVAKNVPIVADSINNTIFSVLKGIISFGEKPYPAKDYNGLLDDFIDSYEKLQKDFPQDKFGWEGKIDGKVKYQSDEIINIEINHYTFTGGAHGYQGLRSLLFDPKTGKTIGNEKLFKDLKAFKAFAEKEFRIKYKIPAHHPINATGLMFEDEKFQLPQNIFFTDEGLLLYYNQYEAASYADGGKELLFPYKKIDDYLAIK